MDNQKYIEIITEKLKSSNSARKMSVSANPINSEK